MKLVVVSLLLTEIDNSIFLFLACKFHRVLAQICNAIWVGVLVTLLICLAGVSRRRKYAAVSVGWCTCDCKCCQPALFFPDHLSDSF
jgi:hypothetical protein